LIDLRRPEGTDLVEPSRLQLFYDTRCEITSPEFPGERPVACRNPTLGAERARKREALLQATEAWP
jgi:hypothetical protein